MSKLPKITTKDVRAWTDERSFERGEEYYHDGVVFNTRRQGMTLHARCQGSGHEAYRLHATFNEDGIVAGDCNCPVGTGTCKHVVAMLLLWIHSPKEFTEVEAVRPALEGRSKEELIALIEEMLRREPDLESLLEMPLPGGPRPTEVTSDLYCRQAEAAFERGGDEWGASEGIADDLAILVESADGFLKEGNHDAAATAYQGILDGTLANFTTIDDEPGHLYGPVNDCVEGLVKCLRAFAGDPARREPILRAIFAVDALAIEQGGTTLGETSEDHYDDLTPEECRLLANLVREELKAATGWSKEGFGGWLLNLEADTLDDEAFLSVCRQTGRRHDLIARLLKLGRLPEVLRETESASDYELLNLTDLLISHGHGDEADRLIEERSRKSEDIRLLEWLKKRAGERKDAAAVEHLTEQIFRKRPSLAGYKEVRKLAQESGRWEALRPKLLAFLQKPAHHAWLLLDIYLDEGEIDEALKMVRDKRTPGYGYGMGGETELRVAEAAEKTRPRAALEIYRARAEAAIPRRNRSAYQEACGFLKKVRALHKALGEEDAWATYIAATRAKWPTLKALQEELTNTRL